MQITCGIDWAEGHHDVAVLDAAGGVLARDRIDTGVTGLSQLLALLAEYTLDLASVPVAIETDKNLIVVALQAAGITVFAINPRAVARYRERHGQSGKKSDPGDAYVLADVLRTGRCRRSPTRGRRSRRWLVSIRRRSGPSIRRSAGCGRCCWSSIRRRCVPSRTLSTRPP